jgi:hypothetical protein
MSLNQLGNSALDVIGKLVFPHTEHSIRRKDARAFLASLALGMLFCFAFGYLLCVVNKHGGHI